jgi:hypothetical protein
MTVSRNTQMPSSTTLAKPIHRTDYLCKMADGSERIKALYYTFEYVKKHLKELKACDCETCRNVITAYRLNKKAMRGATPEQVQALILMAGRRRYFNENP